MSSSNNTPTAGTDGKTHVVVVADANGHLPTGAEGGPLFKPGARVSLSLRASDIVDADFKKRVEQQYSAGEVLVPNRRCFAFISLHHGGFVAWIEGRLRTEWVSNGQQLFRGDQADTKVREVYEFTYQKDLKRPELEGADSERRAKRANRPTGFAPLYALVQVKVESPQLGYKGIKGRPPKMVPVTCSTTLLEDSFRSLNSILSALSSMYEPGRSSHSMNVFRTIFLEDVSVPEAFGPELVSLAELVPEYRDKRPNRLQLFPHGNGVLFHD